jgi:hypothetical protein
MGHALLQLCHARVVGNHLQADAAFSDDSKSTLTQGIARVLSSVLEYCTTQPAGSWKDMVTQCSLLSLSPCLL